MEPALGLLICAFYLFILGLGLASLAAAVWAIVDILNSKNEANWKILWALIVLLLGPIGVALYALLGRKERQA